MPDSTKLMLHIKNSDKQLSEIKNILLQNNIEKVFLGIREEYWTHIILPVCIPILAFFLGRIYTIINDKLKKLHNLKDKERFLFTWIGLIQEPIKRQAKIYNEYAVSLKNSKMEMLTVLNLHLDKLKVIDSVTLVSLIVTNRVGKEDFKNSLLFNYENIVDALRRKDESTKNLLNDLQKVISLTSSVWNDNYKEMQNIIQELHSVFKSLANPKAIYEVLEMFAFYSKAGEKGMKNCMRNFVSKAGPICSNYINSYPQDEIVRKLMTPLGQLKFAYESRNKQCMIFSENFSEASRFILEKSQTLLQIKNDIDKLKFKNFLAIK